MKLSKVSPRKSRQARRIRRVGWQEAGAMELIEAYVTATRGAGASARVTPRFKTFYTYAFASMVDSLRRLAGRSDLGKVALKVTWSNNVKAETVRIEDVTYIVLDQFVGQTFRKLTRFTVREYEARHLDAYLFKLYANLSLVNGHPWAALEFGLCHRRWEDHRVLPRVREEEVEAWLAQQDYFVLAHELAHWFLRSGSLEALAARTNFLASLRVAAAYKEHRKPESWRIRSIDESVRTWRVAYKRAFGALPAASIEQKYRDVYSNVDAEKTDLDVILPVVSQEDEELVEECICDAIATDLVGEFAERAGMRYVDGLRASFAALQNMRFLRQVDAMTKVRVEDLPISCGRLDWDSPDVIRWVAYRTSVFALTLRKSKGVANWTLRDPFTLLDYVANAATLERVHALLSSYNEAFYERLHDHTFDIFAEAASIYIVKELRCDPEYLKLKVMSLTQCITVAKWCCDWL
ncbi:hypothetical protein [Streptomyces sp. NPDC002250]|uniref:hypothetical protein n=1 Tax=Streptomyces sp. NPDC002250 TaxID=3364641 RepID=UPI0036B9D14F